MSAVGAKPQAKIVTSMAGDRQTGFTPAEKQTFLKVVPVDDCLRIHAQSDGDFWRTLTKPDALYWQMRNRLRQRHLPTDFRERLILIESITYNLSLRRTLFLPVSCFDLFSANKVRDTAEWFSRLIESWPELATLSNLADGAGRGLHFSREVVAKVQPLMLALRDLDPAQRLPLVLQVLTLLSRDVAMKTLATHAFSPAGDKVQDRMSKVLNLLHAHAIETPTIQRLADAAAMSVGAFHRFFKRHTGMTVLDYVAQLRIGIACQLLITGDQPIKLVAAEAGYSNAAHFNRQFLERKHMTPREFRRLYRSRLGDTR